MQNDGYGVYRYWLRRSKESNKDIDKQAVQSEIENELANSAAYQEDAMRNGETQPIVASRTKTNVCKITVMPGDDMFIGDLIDVFNERWLCVELYVDEYGIKYGEIWMCNHTFVFQDHNAKIIKKDAIVDDGSYSKGNDKSIPIIDGTYKCYMSLDDESRSLYVDKRLAIDTILDKNGSPILEVGKIKWIDQKTKNYGEGSHLLFFTLTEDVYSKENDNLELNLCDYVKTSDGNTGEEPNQSNESANGYLVIEGRDSIRIGTGRTYKVVAIDNAGNTCDAPNDLEWHIEGNSKISTDINGASCVLRVPLDDSLIGTDLTITCRDKSSGFSQANKQVAVISIG